MPKTKIDNSKKPYVSNYPELQDWLDKHGASCIWQLPNGGTEDEPAQYVELWGFRGGRNAIITIHANGMGWDIFTPRDTNRTDLTLEDAEHRLGIKD